MSEKIFTSILSPVQDECNKSCTVTLGTSARLIGKCLTTFSTSVHYLLYNTATTRCSDNSEDGLVDKYVNVKTANLIASMEVK